MTRSVLCCNQPIIYSITWTVSFLLEIFSRTEKVKMPIHVEDGKCKKQPYSEGVYPPCSINTNTSIYCTVNMTFICAITLRNEILFHVKQKNRKRHEKSPKSVTMQSFMCE